MSQPGADGCGLVRQVRQVRWVRWVRRGAGGG